MSFKGVIWGGEVMAGVGGGWNLLGWRVEKEGISLEAGISNLDEMVFNRLLVLWVCIFAIGDFIFL